MWHTRDELARDHEVLHLSWGVRYKSGVYASKVLRLTSGDLPAVRNSGLRTGRPDLSGRRGE